MTQIHKNIKKETNKTLRCKKKLAEKIKLEEIEKNSNNPRRFSNNNTCIKQGYIPQIRMLRNQSDE